MRTTLGEGYSCYSCCSCYQVKVKSTPRFGLGWSLTILILKSCGLAHRGGGKGRGLGAACSGEGGQV